MHLSIANFCFDSFLVLLVLQESSNYFFCSAQDSTCAAEPAENPFIINHKIKLDRTRYCTREVPLPCYGVTNHKYRFFKDRMSNTAQKNMYIAENNRPPKQSTKNLVMFFAGQQTTGGYHDGLSGQVNGYKTPFERKTAWEWTHLSSDSYANQILNEAYFSGDDTFVGMALDARFNYERREDAKDQILSAYLDYIMDKLSSDGAETILLVGHSRGGCLAMRLGQKMATLAKYPGSILYLTRIIIQTWDPVCADKRGPLREEFGVITSDPIDNPLVDDKSYKVYTTNMNTQFQHAKKSCLAIKSVLSGEVIMETIDWAYDTHAFGHRSDNGLVANYLWEDGFKWYQQSWNDLGHTGITWTNWDQFENHLKNAMKMKCPCGNAKPPRVEKQWCPGNNCYFQRRLPNGRGDQQKFRCDKGFVVVGAGKPSSAGSDVTFLKRNDGSLYTDTVLLTPPKDDWSGVACARVTPDQFKNSKKVVTSKSEKRQCVNAKIEAKTTCPLGWWMVQGSIKSSSSHFKVNSQKFLTTEDTDGRVIIIGIWGEIKNKGAACRTSTISVTAHCLKISEWWSPNSPYTWGEAPTFTKKYSEKHPRCPNVKCMWGTLKELELECNSYSSCTGLAIPISGGPKQTGCLEMCGGNDASHGFMYGTHDYWSK